MKKLFTLLALCWLCAAAPAWAQSPPPDSLRQHLDHLFAQVDKTQVPAPFLEEYGLRFVPLDVFNGTLTDSSRTNMQAWRMAYASVLTSYITGTNPLPTLGDLNTRLQTQATASAAIPIMVQRINYAALRPDALTAGLFTAQNEQLFDVAGRSQSPYLSRVLFMAAPETSVAATGDVSFVFAQNLHVQSGGGSVSNLSIDFGDGQGYRTATWGQPIGASYCTAGTRRVKVRVTYFQSTRFGTANSTSTNTSTVGGAQPQIVAGTYTSYESHFDLEVRAPGCAPAARYSDIGRTVPFGPTSEHSGGMVYIRYGDGSRTQLLRPLIVAEGYDASSVAPHLQKYNYSIRDFLADVNPVFGYNLYSALENAPSPNGLPAGATGYDIVFIDYANGTDDIRRNAALFKEVVDWVNQEKARNGSTEKNVVLGISMGGLVARYGLAKMERAVPNSSDTRLLVTHDSPHRGANTPLGLQALVAQANAMVGVQILGGIGALFGKDIFPEVFEGEQLGNAPATQQLLLVRATRSGYGPFASFATSFNWFIASDYQPMVSGSFPYQFVATSLGSQCGNGSLSPHDELVRYQFSGFLSPLPWIKRTSYNTEVIVNAMPNPGQHERLSSLRIYRQVRTLMVFNSRTYLTNFAFHSVFSNPVAWDGLPGGTQNVSEQARIDPPTGHFSLLWFLSLDASFSTAGDFCFVPTASALDVPIDNVTARSSYVSDLTSSPVRPVPPHFIAQKSYTTVGGGQKFNYPHPFFPARQAEWIFNELQLQSNATVSCSTECNLYPPVSITGSDIVCAGSAGTPFSVAPPFGGVTGWTASPAGLVTFIPANTAGVTSVQAVPTAGARGVVTIYANLSNGCFSTIASRRVAVGEGMMEINNGISNPTCATTGIVFNLTSSIGVPGPYTWTTSAGYLSSNNGGQSMLIDGLPFQDYTLTVTVSSPSYCQGAPDVQAVYYQDYYTQGCPSYRSAQADKPSATLYPNPARETVDVHVENADAAHPVTVRLFDSYGRPCAEQASRGEATLRLNTDKLPAGLYYVHLLQGGKVVKREQLQIEK
ncbi:T9SS type A sorting domain-containing protein [Hymenobacter convexus]|uniref:T9SS type A sorting domain-containing protein n=1 Tax=Hymenobacter sp. CA1UV-4 TaxID=3063782 RepID=UPI00271264AE|nr:T9SS type A sorting domain-containing protein [Hymenobacter sp. CA1UV-4]MDO7850735.1 T9SS type A sorting domain-containing protein [Hymenobacter sp. CA1UV-4]